MNKTCDWILIPARNEASSLPNVIRGIKQTTTDHILVVDSQSTDGTADIARSMGATVIRASKVGYWNALRTGYRFLLQDTICTTVTQLDADGQHDSIHIPRLKSRLITSSEAQWVVGSRQNTGTKSEGLLEFGQWMLRRYAESHTGHSFGDISSGFWVLNRPALSAFVSFKPPNQSADLALRIYAAQNGIFPCEVPTEMGPRLSGQSMHTGLKRRLIHLCNVYQDVQWLKGQN